MSSLPLRLMSPPPSTPFHIFIFLHFNSASKKLMESAGVPVVPGYHGDRQDAEVLRHAAETMGYPGMHL